MIDILILIVDFTSISKGKTKLMKTLFLEIDNKIYTTNWGKVGIFKTIYVSSRHFFLHLTDIENGGFFSTNKLHYNFI